MTNNTSTKFKIPIRFIDLQEDGFHPLISIRLFGKTFTVVLDTGASKTAFDINMLSKAFADAVFKKSERLSTGLGTNSMESSTTTVDDLYIGRLLIDPLEVAVLDLSTINIAYGQLGHPEVLGVLGSDILMRYKAVIDYAKASLRLEK